MQVVENEVHQALAVLDTETGKILNYRQLMRHPAYKKYWQLSSANELDDWQTVSAAALRAHTQSSSPVCAM